MAYIYYYVGDHTSTKHNQDVYLLGQANNYYDDNTYIIQDKSAVKDGGLREGWNLNGGLSITIGGVKKVNDLTEGNKGDISKITKNTRTYNIYQQNVSGVGQSNESNYGDMREYSAINFAGDGTINFIAQTGATTSHNMDNTISIFAKNTSTSHYYYVDERTWNGRIRDTLGSGSAFPTSNVNTDSNAIKADGALTVATGFSGKIEVQSRAYSWGVNINGSDGKPVATNTANGMSNKATAFHGSSVTFKNNFFGTIDASARVSFGSYASRTVSNNSIGAYGVWAETGDVNASNSIWSGLIFAHATDNEISALDATDASGKNVEGDGNASNNIIQSIGIHGANVSIKVLDSAYNSTDVGANILVKEGDNNGTNVYGKEKVGYFDTYSQGVSVMVEDGKVANYTRDELTAISGNPLFGWDELKELDTYRNNNPEDNYALISAVMGKGKDIFIYEDEAMMLVNADVYESGSWKIVVTDSDGNQKILRATLGGALYFGTDPLTQNTYLFYVLSSTAFSDVKSAEIFQYGEEFFSYDVNTATNMKITDTNAVTSIGLVTSGEADKQVTTGIRWTIEIDGLEDLDNTAATTAIDAALENYVFIVKYSYKEKVGDTEVTKNVTKLVKWGDEGLVRAYAQGSNSLNLSFTAGTEIIVDNVAEAVSAIDAKYGVGGLTSELDVKAETYTVSFVAKGDANGPDWDAIGNKLQVDLCWENSRGELFEAKDFDLTKESYVSKYITGDYYIYTAVIDTNSITDANGNVLAQHFYYEIDKNVVISAKVLKNSIVATNNGKDKKTIMTGNEFTAIGIDAANNATIEEVTAGTVIEVEVQNNEVTNKRITLGSAIYDNSVYAAGIRGGNDIVLGSFDGTINVTANNNKLDHYGDNDSNFQAYGIYSTNLTSNSNLNGEVNITAIGNELYYESLQNAQVGAIAVAGNMVVNGVINTAITVDSDFWSYGLRVNGALTAGKLDSTITVSGLSAHGVLVNKFVSTNGTAFEVGGTITVSGLSTTAIATMQAANLSITGNITGKYAIYTDYQHAVSTGYNDDIVEFQNGSKTTGIIDLGGGTNIVKINSGATLEGYVAHGKGNTNIVFYLNQNKANEAIFKVLSSEDASLVSGATFKINITNMQKEESYVLYEYDEEIIDLAAKCWKSARFVIEYNGKNYDLSMVNGKRYYSINGGTLSVSYEDGKLVAKIDNDLSDYTPSKIYTFGATEEDENCAIKENEVISIVEEKFLAEYEKHIGSKADFIVDDSTNTTNDIKLTWLQDLQSDISTKKFVLEYTIKDADGKEISKNEVILSASDCWVDQNGFMYTTKEQGQTTQVPYRAYQYSIANVLDGCTVEWKVADYTLGDMKNLEWSENKITTQKISFISTIETLKNMKGENLDDSSKGISTALAKFTWQAMDDLAACNYAIDHYNVRYFLSGETIDSDTQKEIFALFDKIDKSAVGKQKTVGDWTVLVNDNGEWQVWKTDEAENVYYLYEKTTTTNELMVSGLVLSDRVYWAVQGVDTSDIEGQNKSKWFFNMEQVADNPETGGVVETLDDTKAPEGNILKFNTPTVEVTKRAEVINNNVNNNTENSGTTEDGESSSSGESSGTVTTPPALGKALEANITFSWEDNFSDDKSALRYLMKVNSTNEDANQEVYYFLVVKADDDSSPEKLTELTKLYNRLSKIYTNLRVVSSLNVTASGDNNACSVVFGNNELGAVSGLFADGKTYNWTVTAVDMAGNMTTPWLEGQKFKFTDPDLGGDIVDSATPAKAKDFKVTALKENGQNTGAFNFEFKYDNIGFGIESISLSILKGNDIIASGSYDYILQSDGTGNLTRLTIQNVMLGAWEHDWDGNCTINVITYGANGHSAYSSYTFVQDTVRPYIVGKNEEGDNVKYDFYDDKNTYIVGTVDSKAPGIVNATLTWDPASDDTSKIVRYDIYVTDSSSNGSFKKLASVDGNNPLQYTTELLLGVKLYYFQIVAVDAAGNESLFAKNSFSVSPSELLGKDIDSKVSPYIYDTDDKDGMEKLKAQIVGGISKNTQELDTDVIRVSKGAANGEMQFKITNLKRIFGNGSAIVMTVRNEKTGAVVGKYTIKVSDLVNGSVQKNILIDNTFDENYLVTIESASAQTFMQYGFEYNFKEFSSAEDAAKDNTVFNAQQLSTSVRDTVGYGDQYDNYRFSVEDGKYTLTLQKHGDNTATNSDMKLYIYQVKNGATSLALVKSVTMKYSEADKTVEIKDLLLAEGDYIVRVESPSHAKGANIDYTLSVSKDILADNQNNDDDFFINEQTLTNPCKVPSKLTNETIYAVDKDRGIYALKAETWNNDWVGYGDQYDYYTVDIDKAGEYSFGIYKIIEDELGEKPVNGAVTLTLYSFDEAKNAMKVIKSVTVKANVKSDNALAVINTLLDSGKYYLAVAAPNAAKGDSVAYEVGMAGTIFNKAEGTESFIDAKSITLRNNEWSSGKNYLGFGEADNFYKFTMEDAANLTINLENYSYTQSAATGVGVAPSKLTVTLYKYNANGSGLTAVKTLTVAANASQNSLTLNNLLAGDYVVKVTANDAKAGKSSTYELQLDFSKNSLGTSNDDNIFVRAGEVYSGDTTIDFIAGDYINYYKFNTDNKAGKYTFSFEERDVEDNFLKNLTYNIYYLKDGATTLTKVGSVVSGKELDLYLDSNTTYYIEVNNNKKVEDLGSAKFNIAETEVRDNMDLYAKDNSLTALKENGVDAIEVAGNTASYESWVGYGDLVSWRKLNVAASGSFNLTLAKKPELSVATALTLTLYKLNAAGNGLTKYKTLTVSAKNLENTLANVLLDAGEYYVQVSTATAKGYADYSVTIESSFVTQSDDNNIYINASDAVVSDVDDSISASGWVGYGDEYDYFKISGSALEAGSLYNITVKTNDAVQVTLYTLNPTTGALKALKSVSVTNAAQFDTDVNLVVEQLLNGGDANTNYVIGIKSTNASKGGNATYNVNFELVSSYSDITTIKNNSIATKDYAVFTIENNDTTNTAGIYELSNGEGTVGLSKGVTLYKYDNATGALAKVAIKSQLELTEGTYYLYNGGAVSLDVSFDSDNKQLFTAISNL